MGSKVIGFQVNIFKNQESGHFQSPMKKDEFLFSEDNEGSVPKLDQLGQGEQPGPEG